METNADRCSACQFSYTYDQDPYVFGSVADRELCGPVDETVLATMVPYGGTAVRGQMPVRKLRVVLPSFDLDGAAQERLERARYRDEHSVAELIAVSAEFTALVGAVIARRAERHGYRHLGILISGGLDSGLLVHVCAELKRQGHVDEVTAFHFSWPDLPELASETAAARFTCEHSGVRMHEIPSHGLVISDLCRYYAETFPFPCELGFEYQVAAAAIEGRRLGVDVLMGGVASELSTTAECSKLAEIEQLAIRDTSDPVQAWPIGAGRPGQIPFWIPETPTAAQLARYSEPVAATTALQLAFDNVCKDYWTTLAQEDLIYSSMGPGLPVQYSPYMESDVLRYGARLPSFMHTIRCGGQVYGKALIRVALRELPPAVFLRPGGSPYNAIEQDYIRKEWPAVVDFWNQQSHLADLGLVDIAALRASLGNPAKLLRNSVCFSAAMYVEAWLRQHPDRLVSRN